ncbi:PIG-L deacetylase family protein [Bacillaceae bacterium W0354]
MKRQILKAMNPIIRPITKTILTKHYQADLQPVELTEQNILILAPHVDDETIGLGGTIARYKDNNNDGYKNRQVSVIYMTDGAGSVSQLDKQKLINTRRQEAHEVKDFLNIDELYFLDEPDGALKPTKETVDKLATLIQQINPDMIYVTTHIDCHPDHIATAEILAEVIKQLKLDATIRAYEINTAIPAAYINTVVDITKTFKKKAEATTIFKSQKIDFDGLLKMASLKRNLSQHQDVKYVETFREYRPEDYIKAIDNVKNKYNYNEYFKQMNKEATLLLAHSKNKDFKEKVYKESIEGRDHL